MNSQCDSTGRVGVCCVTLAEYPLAPGQWVLGSTPCAVCGRRCYVLTVPGKDDAAPDDMRAVVDLLGMAL